MQLGAVPGEAVRLPAGRPGVMGFVVAVDGVAAERTLPVVVDAADWTQRPVVDAADSD